jgi:cytochrome c oxidase accessory protein FixG
VTSPAVPGATAQASSDETLRTQVVSLYKKQDKIQPRAVSGWFATWRWVLVWATQLLFYGLAWLPWEGRQAVLFDLGARRFYLFDLVLYPQDFIYLTGLLIISAYALFLFTAVAGRLWCGYACPQTVYTEIFMWVEHRFEGDRPQRLKLDRAGFSAGKLLRRGGKHLAWGGIALWTGFTFVGYFSPIRELAGNVAAFSLGPWETFWILFYGLATYGNAGWLREQVCKYMCPYARFQGAMFDRDTLIIGYDTQRGEPRGTRGRSTDLATAKLGHCIDCGLCVQVCPTGIDIRKGQQYECIGCAACIDVCNTVMDKMHYPRGLVRYDTLNGIEGHLSRSQEIRRVLRPRVLVYSGILVLIVAAWLTSLLVLRSPYKVDVVRDRGVLARVVEDGYVENVYRLQLMNASSRPLTLAVEVQGLEGVALERKTLVTLPAAEARWVPLAVRMPPQAAERAGSGTHPMQFVVTQQVEHSSDEPRRTVEKTSFIVPR